MSELVPAFSNKLELDLKLDLWKAREFDYFLPAGGFDKQKLGWEMLTDVEVFELLFGGGAGGSKTWTGGTWLTFECMTREGLRNFVGRNTITNVERSVLVTMRKIMKYYNIPKEYFKYNAQKHYIEYPKTGSVIEFLDLAFAPSDPFYDSYGSLEFANGWIEEAQQTHFNAYDTLRTRVGRQYDVDFHDNRGMTILGSDGIPLKVRKLLLTANPKKNWLMRNFYTAAKEGTLPKTSRFLPVLAKENPLTPQAYLDQLDSIKDPVRRARLRDGIWEYEDGLYALFKYDALIALFEKPDKVAVGEKVITIDPARQGKDRCTIFVWDGFLIIGVYIADKCRVDQIVDYTKGLQARYGVDSKNVIVDDNGVGGGVTDYIRGSYPYLSHNTPPNNKDGSKSTFYDMRTQCFWIASEMLKEGKVGFARNFEVGTFGETPSHYSRQIISNYLREELEIIEQITDSDDKKIKITKKRDMSADLSRSPDFADNLSSRMSKVAYKSNAVAKQFAVGIVPEMFSEEAALYKQIVDETNYGRY